MIHSGVFVQAHLHLAVAVLLAHVVAEVVEAQGAVLGGDDTVGEVVRAVALVEPPADIQLVRCGWWRRGKGPPGPRGRHSP